MSRINQPSGQIKLTNVSLVRLKKGKRRFEIACYKNKVLEWRSGIETDLDNVLQIPNVFLNVSKGQTAPRDDLDKAFGKGTPVHDIVLEILKSGEMQVGEKERAAQIERVHYEVVGLVAAKLIDPRTKRVYTPGMIEKALEILSSQAHAHAEATPGQQQQQQQRQKQQQQQERQSHDQETPTKLHIWTGVVPHKSAKSQALDAMRALIAHQPIPVARARMRLRITCSTNALKQPIKASKPAAATGGAKGKGAAIAAVAAAGNKTEDSGDKKIPGTVKEMILSSVEQIESQEVMGSEWEVIGFVEPGAYKNLGDFISNETKGQGHVEVLDMAVTHED